MFYNGFVSEAIMLVIWPHSLQILFGSWDAVFYNSFVSEAIMLDSSPHSLQILSGSWNAVFYNGFVSEAIMLTTSGLTHCRYSLGAGMLCFTMVS